MMFRSATPSQSAPLEMHSSSDSSSLAPSSSQDHTSLAESFSSMSLSADSDIKEKNTVESMKPSDVSPISKLHHDILLKIFRLNANMDQDPSLKKKERVSQHTPRALNTTRNSSQVNSLWRNLAINAPTLWANLIDIEYLNFSDDWWRKEIIRRTDNRRLHVKGTISFELLYDSEPWWIEFFKENWRRVRKIELDVQPENDGVGTPFAARFMILGHAEAAKVRKGLSFLSQTAPALECFRLSTSYVYDPLEPGSTLFDDHAPHLTFFEIHNMLYKPQSSWLSQLRSLYVHEHHALTFETGDLLVQVLSQMPKLESLSLKNAVTDLSVSVPENIINLPSLEYLDIHDMAFDVLLGLNNPDTRSTYLPLLSRIIPMPGCSIRLQVSSVYAGRIDVPVLFRLAKNYFEVNQSTGLAIMCGRDHFRLLDVPRPLRLRQMTKTTFFDFKMTFQVQANEQIDGILSQAFKPFYPLSFSTVTHLRLEFEISEHSSLSSPALAQYFSTFSSVEYLATTTATLYFFLYSEDIDFSTLFPKLKVLHMAVGMFGSLFDNGLLMAASISLFLTLRKRAGLDLISGLEYYSAQDNQLLDDLTLLDHFEGLKVAWSTKTIGDGHYICGSGNAEELDFLQKSVSAKKGEKA